MYSNPGNNDIYLMSLFPGKSFSADSVLSIYFSTDSEELITIERGSKTIRNISSKFGKSFDKLNLSADEAVVNVNLENPFAERIFLSDALKIQIPTTVDNQCIIKTNFGHQSDGLKLMEISQLGQKYLITSPNIADYDSEVPVNYAIVIGAFDNTRVTFRVGGNSNTKVLVEDGHLISMNQTIRRTVNEGDVWLIPAYGKNSVLTGSAVFANKAVAVFSGSNSALSESSSKSNYTIMQELPLTSYNNNFPVPHFYKSSQKPQLTIYSNEENNNLFIDGVKIGNIEIPGGTENRGYFQINPNLDVNISKVFEVHAVDPINVVVSDSRITVDGDSQRSFMMQLMSLNQFSKDAKFIVENAGVNYVNIIYFSNDKGDLPDDIVIADNSDYFKTWNKLNTYKSDAPLKYKRYGSDTSDYLWSRNILFEKEGSYIIKSPKNIGVYLYGFNENESFGFPVNISNIDFTYPDTLAPIVKVNGDCFTEITGTVQDQPTIIFEYKSGLRKAYLDASQSYNFSFHLDYFDIGASNSVSWRLVRRDRSLDARAYLVFVDVAGNRKDTVIECAAMFPVITKNKIDFGTYNINTDIVNDTARFDLFKSGQLSLPLKYELYTILDSDSIEIKDGDIRTSQGFSIPFLRGKNLYQILKDNALLNSEVIFNNKNLGIYKDSLGFVLISRNPLFTYSQTYFIELNAVVGTNFIVSDSLEFKDVQVSSDAYKFVTISNPNTKLDATALDLNINNIRLLGDDIGISGSGNVFEVEIPDGLSKDNPIILKPNEEYKLKIRFSPKDEKDYEGRIIIDSDSKPRNQVSVVKGLGLPSSIVIQNDFKLILLSPNPASDYINITLPENMYSNLPLKHGVDNVFENVQVFNMLGVEVIHPVSFAATPQDGNVRIDVSHLPAGLYFVKVGNCIEKFVKI